MRYCYWVAVIIYIFVCRTLGYPSDFKTFKIIPSDEFHGSKTKYISSYQSDSENPVQESRNIEISEPKPEHRTANIPINIMKNNQESLKDLTSQFGEHKFRNEMKLSHLHPYVYNVNLDSPKSLQISVEPFKNDTKFKITDSFLDSFLNPEPQPKSPTTKRPKKTNNKPTNKLPQPNNKPQPRPIKNIKQEQGTEEADETQESTTSEPITTQQGSLIQNNDLTGSSQIGNRESQMVLKPTVIVNIRGTVSNSEGDLSLESRSGDIEMSDGAKSKTPPRNIFHISQEINIDRKLLENNEDIPSFNEPSRKESLYKKSAPEERTIDLIISSGLDEYRLKDRMSIFDDYNDFSLYR